MPPTTSCCPDGSWGAPLDASIDKSVKQGEPPLMIGPKKDLEIYVAKPTKDADDSASATQEKKAVVVFTDVWGFSNRLFEICNEIANSGKFYVVALDCFRGETMGQHSDDIIEWLKKHPYDPYPTTDDDNDTTIQHTFPLSHDIESCFEYLSETLNIEKCNVGAIGFCWGVWAMSKASAMGVHFRCGVGLHPGVYLEERVHQRDEIQMMTAAVSNAPLLFLVAGNDAPNLKPPEGDIAKLISTSSESKWSQHGDHSPKCVEFPDMVHGWASRGDTSKKEVKADAEKALKMTLAFLNQWM